MNEHDEEQPPPPPAAEAVTPPPTRWASPGAGLPYPGEARAAEPHPAPFIYPYPGDVTSTSAAPPPPPAGAATSAGGTPPAPPMALSPGAGSPPPYGSRTSPLGTGLAPPHATPGTRPSPGAAPPGSPTAPPPLHAPTYPGPPAYPTSPNYSANPGPLTYGAYPVGPPFPSPAANPAGSPHPSPAANAGEPPYPGPAANPAGPPYLFPTTNPGGPPFPYPITNPAGPPYPYPITNPAGPAYPGATANPAGPPYPYPITNPAGPAYPGATANPAGPPYTSPTTNPGSPDYAEYPPYPGAAPSYPGSPPYAGAAPSYPGSPPMPGSGYSEYPGYGTTGGWATGWPPPPPPTGGYGPWGPAPPPGWAPPAPAPSGRRNSLTILIVSVLIAAMVGLLIGGQLVGRRNAAVQVPSFFPSQAQTGNGGVNSSGTGLPSAQAKAIANAIDPSVVDIDAQLGYQQAAAAGTGMILTSDGEILTNNHVIAGATSVTATVVGGKKYAVKILGTDPTDDVALIKLVGASGLPPITTGDPSKLTPGEPIVAVGNAGGVGGTPSVATGTVEDLDQSVTASDLGGGNSEQLSGLIEIDAPLEPGDSGGPLLTASRLVVGMDTAASTTGSVQSQTSIGFAIPINRAMGIAQQIAAGHGSATIQLGLPGFLGVSVFENNPTTTPGADIMSLLPGSPTGKAGLVAGDVITSVDGQAVTSPKNLTMVMSQHHPGDKVTVGYTDISGASQTATVTLITGPAA